MALYNVEQTCTLYNQCTSHWTDDNGSCWCFESCKANEKGKTFDLDGFVTMLQQEKYRYVDSDAKGELEMDAIKYLKEKNRMFDSLGRTGGRCKGVNCQSCPFDSSNSGMRCGCVDFQVEYPEKAVAIVEKWSAEHSQKTIMQDFLEKFPKATLNNNGVPVICAKNVGYIKVCALSCKECWNRPLEG